MDVISIIDDICGKILAVGKSVSLICDSEIIDNQVKDVLNMCALSLSDCADVLQEIHNEMCEREKNDFRNNIIHLVQN